MDQIKLFTPKEATQTLPLVKRIVGDILSLGKQIQTLSAELGGGAEENPEVIRLIDQLEDLFIEIESLGCFYKDWNFSMGLVDFPSILNGKEVMLCWRSDEDEIKYYHGDEEGYAGRQLISEELL